MKTMFAILLLSSVVWGQNPQDQANKDHPRCWDDGPNNTVVYRDCAPGEGVNPSEGILDGQFTITPNMPTKPYMEIDGADGRSIVRCDYVSGKAVDCKLELSYTLTDVVNAINEVETSQNNRNNEYTKELEDKESACYSILKTLVQSTNHHSQK